MTYLWFTKGDLAHAFTPTLRRSACGGFEWGLLWSHRGFEERCAGCVVATRGR